MTGIETPAEFPILGLVMENRELKDKIKSMQSDHEKELREAFKAGRDSVRPILLHDRMGNPDGTGLKSNYTFEQWLTQFRKG